MIELLTLLKRTLFFHCSFSNMSLQKKTENITASESYTPPKKHNSNATTSCTAQFTYKSVLGDRV